MLRTRLRTRLRPRPPTRTRALLGSRGAGEAPGHLFRRSCAASWGVVDFPNNLNSAGSIALDKRAMSTTAKPTSVSHTSAKTTSAKPASTKSKSTKSASAKSKGPKPASPWRFYDLKGGVDMNLVAAQPPDLSVIRTLHVPTRRSTSRPTATRHLTTRQSTVQHPAA